MIAQSANLFAVVLWNGVEAQDIELAHLAFVDKAQTMQITRRFVHGFKNSALDHGFCFHDKSAVASHPL